MDRKLLRQLNLIDWDFVSNDETAAGGLHWYPGSFVPGLPGALIEALSKEGDTVFDPYGGIGTTGIAALARGRRAICVDLHPLAVASTYVALGLIILRREFPGGFDALFETLESVVLGGRGQQPSLLSSAGDLRGIDRLLTDVSNMTPSKISALILRGEANVAQLKAWFAPRTLGSILDLQRNLSAVRGSAFLRLIGLVMVSAVCRPLSSQTSSWGHVADNVLPKDKVEKDVARACYLWLRRTFGRIGSMQSSECGKQKVPYFSVGVVDWTAMSDPMEAPKAKLMVTSPPYAGAIDYSLAQRLSFYLLGWSPEEVSILCAQEMGARRKRFHNDHLATWGDQLVAAATRQVRYLTNDALASFVLPHKDFGRNYGLEQLTTYMTQTGWEVVFQKDRSIRQARTRQSWTSIKQETILLFARNA